MCSSPSISSSSNSSSISSKNNKKIKENKNKKYSLEEEESSSSPSTILIDNYSLIPREQLIVKEQLGIGTYGAVFKGLWERPDGRNLAVAMKKVFMLEKEVEILSQIRHKNIIQFYGVSQANPDFYIVTEYAELGSLYEHLHNTDEQISVERRIKWAKQIARGVAYLHYEAPIKVIHRDLKSKNIVIGLSKNNSLQCKICDFGTSKDLTNSWTTPSWGGTAAWMSPEIISQREGITTATDVWSFGVVLWELFSRQVPYNGLTEFKIYSIISQHGVRLCIPDTCPEPLDDLLKKCWKQSPKDRPEMRYVVVVLERLSQDKDLREECAQFLNKGNSEWNKRIKEQLKELDELKLDLARQMEDLKRREQALRKRENSHRNFLHMVDILNVENVCEWNEDCVCEWVQNIAAAASSDFLETTVDKIISSVLQYGINGPRLMEITEKDLECLGVEPIAVRRYIILKLDELRAMNVQLCNYSCCSIDTKEKEENNNLINCLCNSTEKNEDQEPIECSILLHVGMYSRNIENNKSIEGDNNNSPIYRFKIFLDSDWEIQPNNNSSSSIQSKQESATLIKEVNILMYSSDRSIFLGPIQCICPPFGYLEWAQIEHNKQYKKLPLTITLTVSYTDQVIRPQNTQIQIRLSDLSGGPRTLCSKKVKLFIYPQQTDASLCRISATLLQNNNEKQKQQQYRRRSIEGCCGNDRFNNLINNKNENDDEINLNNSSLNTSSSLLLNRSPIWNDLAANIRNYSSTFPILFKYLPKSNSLTIDEQKINKNHLIPKRSISQNNDEKINNKKEINKNKCYCCKTIRGGEGLFTSRNRCMSETDSSNFKIQKQKQQKVILNNKNNKSPNFFVSTPPQIYSGPSFSSLSSSFSNQTSPDTSPLPTKISIKRLTLQN